MSSSSLAFSRSQNAWAGGKTKQPQRFSTAHLSTWRDRLETVKDKQVSVLLDQVFCAQDVSSQVRAVKKVQSCLLEEIGVQEINDMANRRLLSVLVEMHSLCLFRHPLQRTLSSCLQGLSSHNEQLMSSLVRERLAKGMVEGERLWCVQYVEALLEKFPSGEKPLMSILYKVLTLFSDIISECATSALNKQPTASLDLLSLTMKVLMNLLHHSAPLLIESCDHHESHDTSHDLPSANGIELNTKLSSLSLTCKDNVSTSQQEVKEVEMKKDMELMKTLLQKVEGKIKELLIEGDFLSRDTLTSAAMLNVVMVTTCSPSSCVSVEIVQLCENCYFTDSQFPTISQLCVAHSLLAKLSPHQHLTIICDKNQPLLLWLFPIICNLFDVLTETPDRYIASRTLCLWSTAAKESVTCDSVSESVCLSLAPNGSVVQKMLHYVWLMWEDPLESVRHQCKALFNNIVLIVKSLEAMSRGGSEGTNGGKFLSGLCHSLLTLPSSTRGKYVLLTLLVPHLSVGVVLEAWPQLPTGILSAMGHQSLACKAGELWNKMVAQNYSEEEDKTKWQKTWIRPLVSVLRDGVPLARQHVKQYCLPTVLSTSPGALDMCIELLPHSTMSSLTARLACLRSAISSHHQFSLVGTHMDTISTAICHKDEQVVASACALLCESKTTTEPPQQAQLSLVLECVKLHMNTQSAEFRYDLLNGLKKLFNRICDSGHKLERMRKRGKAVCDDIDNIVTSHKDFLKTIAERCFEVLHPLSTYQRRHFVLSVLQLMRAIFSPSTSGCIEGERFSQLVTMAQYRTLVHTLWDTFDSNRSIAVELLLSLPTHFSGLQNEGFLATAIGNCCELIASPKSVSCVTGYYLTKLLLVLAPDKLTDRLIKSLQDSSNYEFKEATIPPHLSSQLSVGWGLIGLLKTHLSTASRNLVAASVTAPMHGVLLAIRSMLESIHISTIQCSSVTVVKELLAAIMSVCSELSTIVFPVVCNSSPEGFLPSCEVQPVEKEEELEGSGGIHGNAQSLLLCCWHCCKELVAVVRVLVDQAGIRAAMFRQETLLTSDQLEVISSLLLHLLTEARHRGAFEIASTGFTTLCRYLWSSPDPSLRSRPEEWMNELLSSLSHSSSLTQLLSITRRSAGLPFYVQAILTTEPQAHSRTCLSHTVTTLLSVAASHTSKLAPPSSSSSPSTISPVPAAVHALNILRALYRESKLGEVMVSFIAEGVMVAVRGFSSSSWTIRNSSTLLLSALVTRIFGVKKVHEEHSMENKMSAHEFFSRFFSLHQFLLSELITAASQDGSRSERLFPVLLVLSRLKPSPQLRNSSLHLLPPFLPPLISLASCSVWKCRVLIAQSLVATLTSTNSSQLLISLIDKMSCTQQNQLHGLLLMVVNVAMESITMAQERDEQPLLAGGEEVLVCLLKKSHLGKRYNHCTITRALYLHCVTLLLDSCPVPTLSFGNSTTESLHSLASDCQDSLLQDGEDHSSCYGPADPSLAKRQFQFLTTVKPVLAISSSTILPSDQLALQLILQSKSPSNSVVTFLNRALQEGTLAESVINGAVKLAMERNEQGYQLLCTILDQSELRKSIESTLFQVFTVAVQAIHDLFIREELLIAMLKFIQRSLKIVIAQQKSTSYKLLASLLHQLREWCNETSPDSVRAAIAALVGRNWDVFVTSCEEDDCSLSHLFWQMSVTLLQDVVEEVREEMCSSLSEMLSSTWLSSGKKPSDSVLCQQSTLRSLIASISHIYQDKPTNGVSLLLSLLPTDSPQNSQLDPVSRLLFNEDKTNAFAEEAELLQLIWKETEKLLPLITDKEMLHQLVGADHRQMQQCAAGNPWMDPTLFCDIVKKTLLVNALQLENGDGWSHFGDYTHPLLGKLTAERRQQ